MKKKNRIILFIVLFYLIVLAGLLFNGNGSEEPFGFLLISFILIIAGTHGLQNKYDAAARPPRNPVYDKGIEGIMGRLGNILLIFIGIIVFALIFNS